MASKTEIANIALSHNGIGKEIGNLDTSSGQAAESMRRFYETARDMVLRDFPWPFAMKIAALGLVEEDPNDEWGYSYRYPSDCIRARRILSGIRNDSRQTRSPFRITSDASGKLVYSDVTDAEMEYTKLVTDTGMFPPDFVMALSYLLAYYTAPRLTAGDPFQLRKTNFDLYQYEISKARANAFNEEQLEEEPMSEFIRARDGDTILGDGADYESFPGGFSVS